MPTLCAPHRTVHGVYKLLRPRRPTGLRCIPHHAFSRTPRRTLLTTRNTTSQPPPDFAFAFDIDGVLLRGPTVLPRARAALSKLAANNIPFILLTNGGGKPEAERAADLTKKLGVQIPTERFVQSHSPFAEMEELKRGNVLVVGGDGERCRLVAEGYGFESVIIPADIAVHTPQIWPFVTQHLPLYETFARPLPSPIDSLQISSIFIYHEPRDWALDTSLITDLLLSHQGILGTYSAKNGRDDLPNRGYQQDGQPPLFCSNGDLLWPAEYHLPRFAQGMFRVALEGIWRARTGVELRREVIGKPTRTMYGFAERTLLAARGGGKAALRKVYMIGDNPDSDIRGGNEYVSPHGTKWETLLVSTGVYQGGTPTSEPSAYVGDVYDAVEWALKDAGWEN